MPICGARLVWITSDPLQNNNNGFKIIKVELHPDLFVDDALAAPGIGAVEGAVTGFDDGRIGIFACGSRGILYSDEVLEMDAILTDSQT